MPRPPSAASMSRRSSLNAITNLVLRTAVPLAMVLLLVLGSKSLRAGAAIERSHQLAKLRKPGAVISEETLLKGADPPHGTGAR